MSKFQRAERRKVKLKIALTGPSGSGKTMSALRMARGIVGPDGRIAVIDTENDSASLYSDRFEFDTLVVDPPYTIEKYVSAIQAAEDEKYDVVVIDSISHAWAGDGGLLSKKEAMDARGGNQFANWGTITKEQEMFKGVLLNAGIHMLVTMRSKQEYTQVGDNGKLKVQKLGLAPIQRDGMEYEFTTVFDVAMDHKAAVSKDRTGLFGDNIAQITEETGATLVEWLGGAKAEPRPVPLAAVPDPIPEASRPQTGGKVTEPQLKRLRAIQSKHKVPDEIVRAWVLEHGVESSKDLHWRQYNKVIEKIEAYQPTEEQIPY